LKNKMERKQIDRLVKSLGMTEELQPLLESNANGETGYDRFERAVERCLQSYSKEGVVAKYISNRSGRLVSCPGFNKFTKPFVNFYGIGCPAKNLYESALDFLRKNARWHDDTRALKKIAEEAEEARLAGNSEEYQSNLLSKGYPKETHERIIQEKSGQSQSRINIVTEVLKFKHKKDIWHGTL